MKRVLLAALVYLLIALPSRADIRATWTASPAEKEPGRIQLQISQGSRNNLGHRYDLSDLSGLTAAQVDSTVVTPVQFRLVRDAGTLSFEGTFKAGLGAGQLVFTANPSYIGQLKALGVAFEMEERREARRSDEQHLFELAALDVSISFIRSMQSAGYDHESLERYVEMRIFNVTPALVQQFQAAGFQKLPAEDLIASAIHRVTPEYIDQMRSAGYPNLSFDDLVASRIHHATPDFIRSMRAAGFDRLSFDDLISFRIHGVTPELIAEYRAFGYDHLTPDDLVSMRIHRVTPQFIRELKDAGYEHVPVEKMVEMKIRHIQPKDLNRAGRD